MAVVSFASCSSKQSFINADLFLLASNAMTSNLFDRSVLMMCVCFYYFILVYMEYGICRNRTKVAASDPSSTKTICPTNGFRKNDAVLFYLMVRFFEPKEPRILKRWHQWYIFLNGRRLEPLERRSLFSFSLIERYF